MTEGNGHVIDPDGQARRALHAAVAEHGPEALSNAVIMDGICQERLGDLPGEAILIGSAARTDVPALLRELIPGMGNYGAIHSVAATLAEAHGLDTGACLWVVREYARALGLIASGTQPSARLGSGRGPGPGAEGTAAAEGAAAGETAGGESDAGASDAAYARGAAGTAGARTPGGPPRRPSGSRVLNRNTIGVAAAVALVAGYLGVAAAAHLSPFPARTAAATSSAPASQASSTSATPDASPDPAPDPTPTSDYQILLGKIPASIKGTDNCRNAGTSYGATAVSQCAPGGLAASTLIYYLYPDQAALRTGFASFLTTVKFRRETGCTTGNGTFVNFTVNCDSNFTSTSPVMSGSVAEYANQNNNPIIVTSDNEQNVMVVLVGADDGDLLAYWKKLQWVVP